MVSLTRSRIKTFALPPIMRQMAKVIDMMLLRISEAGKLRVSDIQITFHIEDLGISLTRR